MSKSAQVSSPHRRGGSIPPAAQRGVFPPSITHPRIIFFSCIVISQEHTGMTQLVKRAPPPIRKPRNKYVAWSTLGDQNLINYESCRPPALMMPRTCCGGVLIQGWRMFYQSCHSKRENTSYPAVSTYQSKLVDASRRSPLLGGRGV
jgi:hypothetical protein